MPPGAIVNKRLTYGQSVGWNNLLLAALESANKDKEKIRLAEQQRAELNVESGTTTPNP